MPPLFGKVKIIFSKLSIFVFNASKKAKIQNLTLTLIYYDPSIFLGMPRYLENKWNAETPIK